MLELKFGISNTNTLKALNLSDLTGAYNSASNVGGWNAPNSTTASVMSATFTVLSDNINATIDVWNTLPTTDTALLYPITNVDLGLDSDANIPSDIYLGTYVCTTNDVDPLVYTDSHYYFYDAPALCCLATFTAKLTANCGCDDKAQQALAMTIIEISALIKAINEAVSPSCNDIPKAKELLKQLNSICADCGGCGCS